MVADAAASHGRALAAHAKTLMYAKGWEKDGLKGANACFEFDLLKADKVTKIKATSHSTTAGTYPSKEIAIADLPDCAEKMVSPGDARKCIFINNYFYHRHFIHSVGYIVGINISI